MESDQAQQQGSPKQSASDLTEEQPKPQKSSKTLTIVLVVITILSLFLSGYLAYQNYQLRQEILQPVVTPEPYPIEVKPSPTVNVTSELTANWQTYTSSVFNYSFKYPMTWNVLMFDEADPGVTMGANTMQNYSLAEVEKYMDHGSVDWVSFIGDKPAINVDFAVYSKNPGPNNYEDKSEFLDGLLNEFAKQLGTSDLKIDNLETEQYKAVENLGPTDVPEINTFVAYPDDERIIYMNVYFYNIESYELLKKTAEWNELSSIISTFKFTE